MDGERSSLLSSDGVDIGLMTAGSGEDLLLVHGGMGRLERWEPLWRTLSETRRVTAMDRRGRGSSGEGADYSAQRERDDIIAVAGQLARRSGRPVDVFAHSIGATFTLSAAAVSDRLGRLVLYEPPGRVTVAGGWPERVSTLVAAGQVGRAAFLFLTEIIGLSPQAVEALRQEHGGGDVLQIAAATLPREARALGAWVSSRPVLWKATN